MFSFNNYSTQPLEPTITAPPNLFLENMEKCTKNGKSIKRFLSVAFMLFDPL